MLALAFTSIFGTIIPQNKSFTAYSREYSELFFKLFKALDLFDMYHSWWFQLLFFILTLNIIVCSIDRLSGTWKIVFKKKNYNPSSFKNKKPIGSFEKNILTESLKDQLVSTIFKGFGKCDIKKTGANYSIFAEKGRMTRLGVYAVHLSIVIMIAGALAGSFFGFEGYVNIPEGEIRDTIILKKSNKVQKLDFGIKCNDFKISFYKTGAPKEYRSNLTIIENGKQGLKKDIIVNSPIRYKGINIFQSNYGKVPSRKTSQNNLKDDYINLNFIHKKTGGKYNKKIKTGERFDLPEGAGEFAVKSFTNSYKFMGRSLGEAFICYIYPQEGEPEEVILPVGFLNFDKMRKGKFIFSVSNQNLIYYTGLQVTKDPGVWIVYTGFMLMIAGCFITFFMSHQQLYVEIVKKGKKSTLTVFGKTNKNKTGIKNKIIERIRKINEQL